MAGIADDLKRIPMSPGLVATLTRAADYAQAQSQSEVALEHLLLALTEDDDAAQVLSASHVDIALLKTDVSQYLGGLDLRAPGAGQITLASDLKRILEAAAAAASQGRRREINGAIVLAAIVGDGRSSAAHMLRAQGLTFEEAIKALQRALASPPKPEAPKPDAAKPEAEDIIATARARVQTRAAPGMPPVPARPEPVAAAEPVVPEPPAPEPKPAPDSKLEAWPPPVRSSLVPDDEFAAARQFGQSDAGSFVPSQPDPYGDDNYDPPFQPGPSDYAHQPQASYQSPQSYQPQPQQPPPPRNRPPEPQSGTRWPAPVAPAWRDHQTPAQRSGTAGPPPLPSPAAPPPLPSQQALDDSPRYAPPNLGAAWPSTHEQPPDESPQAGWQNGQYETAGDPHPASYPTGNDSYDAPWPQQEAAPQWPQLPSQLPFDPGPRPSDAVELEAPAAASRPAKRRKSSERAASVQMGESIPRAMRTQMPSMVEIRLSNADFRSLAEGLQGPDAHRHAAMVTPAVSVKLSPPDGGFMIEAVSPETQWLDAKINLADADFASWRWNVTPLTRGKHRLQLVVSARTASPGGTATQSALPEQIVHVAVGTNWSRALLKLLGWTSLIALGWLAALYANPLIATVLGAMKLGAIK